MFWRWKGIRYIRLGKWWLGVYLTRKQPPINALKGWW